MIYHFQHNAIDEIHGEGNPPTEYSPCFVSQFYPYMLDETDCNYAGVIYYYHPDYGTSRATMARSAARFAIVSRDLGNVEYITDRDGEPYQYFHYSALSVKDYEPQAKLALPSPEHALWCDSGFCEAVVENKANTGTHVDYFRFNGKELDPETGNYYYGASSRRDLAQASRRRSGAIARPSPARWRGYYDPRLSVWLSVDPLAHKLSLSPYVFVADNPIMIVDPDGRQLDIAMNGITLSQLKSIVAEEMRNRISVSKSGVRDVRSSVIFHELYENFLRTEGGKFMSKGMDYNSKADGGNDAYGAHARASNYESRVNRYGNPVPGQATYKNPDRMNIYKKWLKKQK